ncbi:hypothetical protein B0T17DRAFT_613273 [Bombardia bombarda]|uniref:Uncharacterized protein n=1 Tax=Bombardia bombarda TaxID=252184 RepID=A0AA39XP31_9PEZI|nr:hypothetical protein B0T17DRAFT_613273 [Bombardia bombarda]
MVGVVSCRRGADIQLDGISHSQRRDLCKKSNRAFSEENQWFAVWDILFPEVQKPTSAYIDSELSADLCLFREYWQSAGRDVLFEVVKSHKWISLSDEEQETHGRRLLAEGLDRIYLQWLAGQRELFPPFSSAAAEFQPLLPGFSSALSSAGSQTSIGANADSITTLTASSSDGTVPRSAATSLSVDRFTIAKIQGSESGSTESHLCEPPGDDERHEVDGQRIPEQVHEHEVPLLFGQSDFEASWTDSMEFGGQNDLSFLEFDASKE